MPNVTGYKLGSAFRVERCMSEAGTIAGFPDDSPSDFVISWSQDCDALDAKNASFDTASVESTVSGGSTNTDDDGSKKHKRNKRKNRKSSKHIGDLFRLKKSSPDQVMQSSSSNLDDPIQLSGDSPSVETPPAMVDNEQSCVVDSKLDVERTEKLSGVEQSPWLLRLFESSLFDMHFALQYFFKKEDDETRAYLANRLFGFPASDVDFYLLQLVSLYHKSPDAAKHLHPYFIHRCTQSTEFAIHLVWLLDTFDPPQLRTTSSSLCRPSSVPTFSQVNNTTATSLNTLLDHSNGSLTPRQVPSQTAVVGSTASDMDKTLTTPAEAHEYTVEALRNIVFPTQEHTLMLLSRFAANEQSSHESVRSARLARTTSELQPTAQHSATLPLPDKPAKVERAERNFNPYGFGHKRAVSDLSSLVSGPATRPFGLKHQQEATKAAGSRGAFDHNEEDRWSSVDSAVGFSRELDHEQETSDAALHGIHDDWNQHSGRAAKINETSRVTGSCFSVNKIITQEPFSAEMRGAHSLQRLSLVDTSTISRDADLRLLKRSDSSREHRPQNSSTTVNPSDTGITTTSSLSPPDSGLQLVVSTTSRAVSEDQLNGKTQRPSVGPMDPVITLQLQLVPRLIPEWDFIDFLLRLARRLVPISSKEQRTAYLQAELTNLNLHLPARVWLPVIRADHIILRIPPTAAVCLNSKNKAPYLIYLEVLPCSDPWSDPLPCRPSSWHTRSSFPSVTNSFTSFATFAWNSSTPSSGGAPSAIAAPDALSLVSSESGHSIDHRSFKEGSTVDTIDDVQTLQEPVAPSIAPKTPVYVAAGDIRNRLKEQAEHQPHWSFKSDPEDPSAAVLKEPWHMKCQRIRESSPWGSLPGWRLTAAIVKVGDDLRQEQLAYQLLSVLQRIWRAERVPLWLRPLTVIVTSHDSGLIEPVPDTVSLHQIRRHVRLSLLDYFHREFGPPNSEAFLTAQRNFAESCAAYCLVGYLLQVKDRHNGNILLDSEGHVIHIDYGFILSASPGKNLGFETSPFKLTSEQVAVMGDLDGDMFKYFKCLLLRGLLAARKHMEEVCILVEIARYTCPQLPCFARSSGAAAINGLRQRFQLSKTEDQLRQFVDFLIDASLDSMTTKLYDRFQYHTNGIQ